MSLDQKSVHRSALFFLVPGMLAAHTIRLINVVSPTPGYCLQATQECPWNAGVFNYKTVTKTTDFPLQAPTPYFFSQLPSLSLYTKLSLLATLMCMGYASLKGARLWYLPTTTDLSTQLRTKDSSPNRLALLMQEQQQTKTALICTQILYVGSYLACTSVHVLCALLGCFCPGWAAHFLQLIPRSVDYIAPVVFASKKDCKHLHQHYAALAAVIEKHTKTESESL
jgi:hypothetical protein